MNLKAMLGFWIFVIVVLMAFGFYVFFVSSAPIDGKVVDYNGEPISGAIVSISGFEEKYVAITDKQGNFHIENNFLQHIENGNYHVKISIKHGDEEYIGNETNLKIEGKPIQKTFYFKNKEAKEVYNRIIEAIKAKFDELRPVSHPSEEEEKKMKYESKSQPARDTVDLKDLGDYSIVLSQDENKKEVYVDLKYGNKLIERAIIILNCSLFSGYIRPENYHPELLNSLGLDELTNELKASDGVVKIWNKNTWVVEGPSFSDVIISPISVYNERIGKSKSFFDFNNGLAYALTQAGFNPKKEEEEQPPPSEEEPGEGFSEGVEINLTNLENMKIHIVRKNIKDDEAIVCIELVNEDGTVSEKGICVKHTNIWIGNWETQEGVYRPNNMCGGKDKTLIKNMIGIVDIGKVIDENTIELSKEDGTLIIREQALACNKEATDVVLISTSAFEKYFVSLGKEISGDKVLIHYKNRWRV